MKSLAVLLLFVSSFAFAEGPQLVSVTTASSTSPVAKVEKIAAQWSIAEKRLKKAGFQPSFIKMMAETYEPAGFQNILELNLTLFMRKTDDHGVQVTDDAVERVRGFMSENEEALAQAEKAHGVPPQIVASLLWIESRYGKMPGKYHVLSIFADLLQAERADVIKHLKSDGAKRFTEKPKKTQLAKISPRAKKKVAWALGELRALQKIYSKDPQFVRELRGSFAGAFGLPQFLPTAYSRWAQASGDRKTADLYRVDDSVQSVANYLHQNGWIKQKNKTRLRALMNYNNSRDYANAILRLAERAGLDQAVADVKSSLPPQPQPQ